MMDLNYVCLIVSLAGLWGIGVEATYHGEYLGIYLLWVYMLYDD